MVIKLMRSYPLNLNTILQIIHSKGGRAWWREGELEFPRSLSVTIRVLGRMEEEGHKFGAILSYIRPVLKGSNKVT